MPSRLPTLPGLLRYKRPARSETEEEFIRDYIPLDQDDYGNLICSIGPTPTTLWSCHTDTVHKKPGTQTVSLIDDRFAISGSNCLGADDTTGIWIMLNMISRKVPGLYIFHRDEEVGGLGSRYIATKTPHLLNGIKRAIAFDRKGYAEAITHQRNQRTASDAFASTLGVPTYGTFTDTANYTDLVPECTNISVGYFNQHTPREYQDIDYAQQVLERICRYDPRRAAT